MITKTDALQTFFVYTKDANTGNITKIAIPAKTQIGLPGRSSGLDVLGYLTVGGRFSLNVIERSSSTISIAPDETIVSIIYSVPPVNSRYRVNLPDNPVEGQIHVIKDVEPIAGTYPIDIFPHSTRVTIDGATHKTLVDDGASTVLYYSRGQWNTLSSHYGAYSVEALHDDILVYASSSLTLARHKSQAVVGYAGYTITLPASPIDGDRVDIRAIGSFTLNANTSQYVDLAGTAASSATISNDSGYVLRWADELNTWYAITDLTTSTASTTQTCTYSTSFTSSDLSDGLLTITHELANQYCSVTVIDESNQTVVPDDIVATSTNVATVDLTSHISALTGNTWKVLVIASGTSSGYSTSFTSANLSSGILTLTHNLSEKYVGITVWDGNDIIVVPDQITMTSTTATSVNLSSFGTIAGTWHVLALQEGSCGYLTTFTSNDVSSGNLSVLHQLNTQRCTITLFDNNDNVVLPDTISATSRNRSTLSLASHLVSLTGTWRVLALAKGGCNGATTDECIPIGYTDTFTSADLIGGQLTVVHSLDSKYVITSIYDNNDKLIIPDDVTATSTSTTTFDLTTYEGDMAGTWNVSIISTEACIPTYPCRSC